MNGVVSDSEQEISKPVDGARAHEVCSPQQKLEMWVVNIENRLGNQFPDLTEPTQGSTVKSTKKDNPPIYPSDCFPQKFDIGIHFYGCARKDLMWEYVAFMSRWLGFNVNLYIQYMKEKEDQARGYYEETDEKRVVIDSNYFLESLMVGSCFLSFAIVLFQNITSDNGIQILKGSDYSCDLDLRSKQFKILYREIMNSPIQTKLDMLNLGNQIPWFAVKAVFTNSDLTKYENYYSIDTLAMSCFDDLYPRANKLKVQRGGRAYNSFTHLLHIFHWTRSPDDSSIDEAELPSNHRLPRERFATFHIPSATELLGSATVIKKLADGVCDVEYSNKRVSALMQLAPLHVFSYSDKIFADLLEFEQRYLLCGLPVTAYIACMKSLLQTKEDVKLLQKNGIVQNTLKDEKDVLDFVHHLRKSLSDQNAFLPIHLIEMSKMVNKHHEKRLVRYYAEFKSQYCPNRWVIISIIGAITLFALTFIQTIYTTLGYYKI